MLVPLEREQRCKKVCSELAQSSASTTKKKHFLASCRDATSPRVVMHGEFVVEVLVPEIH